MNNYERYSSRQLFEAARTGPENVRNHLIGLLLQREDRDPYIREVLAGDNRALLGAGLRSLAPSDAVRFRPLLERLLSTGDEDVKRTIVNKWGEGREKSAIPSLLGLVNDRNEDPLLKKMAIFSLGEIGDRAAFSPLSSHFDETDADAKIAILIALNKISSEEARPLFIRAGKDRSPDVRYWAQEFLKNAGGTENADWTRSAGGTEIPDDRSIQRTWIRNLLSWPDRDRLSFLSNGEGVYEEDKAGETTLLVPFGYRLENEENIVFVTTSGEEFSTGYQVTGQLFRHPYKGNLPCLALEFDDRNIRIDRITITGSPYYFLLKDIT